MKAFKVKYYHGHFIDVETQRRLIPVQGAEYIISASDKAFKTEDAKLDPGDTLKSKEKAAWAEQKFGNGNYEKIMNEGDKLFFRVGNSKSVEGDESYQYIFICTLLEDLYFHLIKGKLGDEEEHWRLAECKCSLESCFLGGLILTEKVPAKSLNSLFNNTVQFYFSMQRSAAANAITAFFIYREGMEITFDGTVYKRYESLGTLRKNFVSNRNRN